VSIARGQKDRQPIRQIKSKIDHGLNQRGQTSAPACVRGLQTSNGCRYSPIGHLSGAIARTSKDGQEICDVAAGKRVGIVIYTFWETGGAGGGSGKCTTGNRHLILQQPLGRIFDAEERRWRLASTNQSSRDGTIVIVNSAKTVTFVTRVCY
jgi:hypothetical protein